MTKIPMLRLARSVVPFLVTFLISLGLITAVPGISMGLVSALSKDTAKVAATTTPALDADADFYGKNIKALDPASIPAEYHWRAAMTVADSSINYKMVSEFAYLIHQNPAVRSRLISIQAVSWATQRNLRKLWSVVQ